MKRSENDAVERGRQSWARLKGDQTWDDWMTTGTALQIGREECLAATHANDLDDKKYRNAYSDWLKINGFDDMDKGVRSRLFKCMERRADIEQWRATLTMTERLSLNHPNSVVRKWERSTLDDEGKPNAAPAKPGLREANAALQEELDAANVRVTQLERSGDNITEGRDWNWADSAEDIARIWYRLQPTKSVRIASALMQLHKSTTKK